MISLTIDEIARTVNQRAKSRFVVARGYGRREWKLLGLNGYRVFWGEMKMFRD